MLRARSVIILSPVNFEYMFQRSQQMAATFSRQGRATLFVEPYSPSYGEHIGIISTREARPNLFLWTFFGLPYSAIHSLGAWGARTQLETTARRKGIELRSSTLCLCQQPLLADLAKGMQQAGCTLVYDVVDDWELFGSDRVPRGVTRRKSQELLETADAVTATSAVIAKRLRTTKEIGIVPNGVSKFSGSEVKSIDIIYIGSMSSLLDYDLIDYLTRALGDLKFVFVGGPLSRVPLSLKERDNTAFTGLLSHERAMELLARARVAILPFREGSEADSVDSVKLYEYLSAGVPVVSTRFQQSREFAGVIGLAACGEEFAQLIRNSLGLSAHKGVGDEFLKLNSWEARCEAILSACKMY